MDLPKHHRNFLKKAEKVARIIEDLKITILELRQQGHHKQARRLMYVFEQVKVLTIEESLYHFEAVKDMDRSLHMKITASYTQLQAMYEGAKEELKTVSK